MSYNPINPPIKFHGGKHYLADKIHEIAAPFKYDAKNRHDGWLHRVVTHGGGFGEGWNWDYKGVSEVYNDINGDLTNLFLVLQCESKFPEFQRKLEAIPFSQFEWERTKMFYGAKWRMRAGFMPEEMVYYAVEFFKLVRQSLAGRMDSFAPLSRNRTRRGMNEQASAWLTAIEGLPRVHDRLKRVVILNQDALAVIKTQDGPKTLFYLDPPYCPETRVSKSVYAYEMSMLAHARLLVTLSKIQGRFMLSGYDHPLYCLAEKKYGWQRHEFDLPNNAASGGSKRRMQEIIWTNFQ